MKLTIFSCIYNDWDSVNRLLVSLNDELGRVGLAADVLLVDDGSTQSRPEHLKSDNMTAIQSVQVLRLRNNIGHQRAIAIGLSYIYENKPCDAVVIMDGDGEDEPADVVRLVHALQAESNQCVIFAERSIRSEGWCFSLFYHIYQWLFFKLTGSKIRFGNFSIVPFSILEKIVVNVNLWNHYAAAVSNSRLLFKTIPSKRGRRFYGKSKLNFISLVVHGLSAMSCYNEVIAARLLFGTFLATVILISGIIGVAAIRLFTKFYIAGWATYTVGILIIIFLQVLLFSMTFTFTLLGNRKNQPFIPLRDYAIFIEQPKD